jgi:hypothetical protein
MSIHGEQPLGNRFGILFRRCPSSSDVGEVQVQTRHDGNTLGIGVARHAARCGIRGIDRDVGRLQRGADVHDEVVLVRVEVVETELGDVRITAGGGGRRAGVRNRGTGCCPSGCGRPLPGRGRRERPYPVDPDELAPAPPVPQHAGAVQRRGRRGVVDVVEFVGNADLEADAGVRVAGDGSRHGRVGGQRAAAAIPPQVEQGDVPVLPDAVLLQFERLAAAVGLDQHHVVDVEAPVGDLVGAGLAEAHVAVGRAAGEVSAVDLGVEFDHGATIRPHRRRRRRRRNRPAAPARRPTRWRFESGISHCRVAGMGHAGFSLIGSSEFWNGATEGRRFVLSKYAKSRRTVRECDKLSRSSKQRTYYNQSIVILDGGVERLKRAGATGRSPL